jgi:hypothetical protein
MFVQVWNYHVHGRDPDRPWIIVSSRAESVELGDDEDFHEWAAREWNGPKWTVELDPGQEPRLLGL